MRALLLAPLVACGSATVAPVGPGPSGPVAAPAAVDVFRDLAVDPASCKEPPPATIARVDALADLDTVERILRRGYAGLEERAQFGVNWDREFSAMRGELAAMSEPIDSEAFRTWLAKHLAVTADHSMEVFAYGPGGTRRTTSAGTHQDAYVLDLAFDGATSTVTGGADPAITGMRLDECKHGRDERTLGPKGKVGQRIMMSSETAPPPDHCRFEQPDDDKVTRDANLPYKRFAIPGDSGPAFEQKKRVVPVMRVRSLNEKAHASELEQLGYASLRNFQYQAMVLDLRGVEPGDYSLVYFFQSLLGSRLKGVSQRNLASEVTSQGDLNALACAPPPAPTGNGEDDDKQQVDERAAELKLAREEVEDRAKGKRAERTWMRGRTSVSVRVGGRLPTRPYPGVFILVVDATCTGTCEEAVVLARQLPRTIVVGENTGGAGSFGDAKPYRLPRSRVWISIASTVFEGVTEEGRGHQPDFWLDTEQVDATIDAIATCAIDASCARDIVRDR